MLYSSDMSVSQETWIEKYVEEYLMIQMEPQPTLSALLIPDQVNFNVRFNVIFYKGIDSVTKITVYSHFRLMTLKFPNVFCL